MKTGDGKKSSSSRASNSLQIPGAVSDFLELAFDAAVTFDACEQVTSWNPAAEQLYGWTAQEALGKTSAELFWPVSTSQEKEIHKQRQSSLKRGETLRGEHEVFCKDGSAICVRYAARGVFDAQGQFAGSLSVYRDLSAQAQNIPGQSHQKSDEILASIQDDFYVLDRNWVFIHANRQFTSKIGKEPKDFIGNNIWEMFPRHQGTIFEKHLRAAMDEREIQRFEIPGKYTNAWYRMTAFPSPEGITVLGTDISERKQAEEALRESEERLRQLLETSPVAIGFGDSTGRIFEANMAFYQLTGYSRQEVEASQLGWDQLTAPEYAELDREMMATLAASGSAGPYEKEYIRKDGSRVPLLLSISKLPGRDEHIAFVMDMTERNRTRQQIFESNQRLIALMNALPVGVSFSDDLTAQYVTGNPTVLAQFEVGREDNLSASAPDSRAPGRQVQFFQDGRQITDADLPLQRAVAEKREIPPMEFEVLLPSGRRWWASGSGAPLRDQNGNVIGGVAVTQDITARKQGEEQLRELSQRLTYHVDNSPLAVIEWGSDMRLIRWSGAAERIFGWTAEEVLGKRMEDLHWIYEEDAPQVDDVSSDLRTGADPKRFSANRNYCKDGSVVYCDWYNSSLVDETGRLRSILSLVLDVTARRQAEEALHEHQAQLQSLNETLEQKVQEKTVEVHRLASDLIKAVQHERHRISHILHDDLQQRIYAVQMQLSFLHEELEKDHQAARQEAAAIEKQLADILSVTRHLSIDLSPPILRDEGLTQAIHWLAAQMRQQYGLPIELQTNEPFAIPDEALHVLLFNCVRELLFNVVKHARARRAVVALQWADACLRIEVSDDGRGFPANMPEARADEDGNLEEDRHSGLGLATIRHQLSLFGGRLEIESRPGAGARVILVIPVTEAG